MLETILAIVSGVGTVATTANTVVDLIQKVKGLMRGTESTPEVWRPTPEILARWHPPPMQPFHQSVPDPFGGGRQWVPQLQNLAGQFGNPWVPMSTQSLLGINMTGIWAPPMNPFDQTYIRQFGPYLNMIAGIGGVPTLYAEGLLDPTQAVIHAVGRYVTGAPMEARAQLLPNWILQGMMMTLGPFGQPVQLPIWMTKVG
jgi:hypothetical protein